MSSRFLGISILTIIFTLCGLCAFAQTATIQTGDTVKVTVLGCDDMGASATVDSDGGISLPMIGSCVVGGKTVAEASADIRKALLKYVKDPQVSVDVTAKAKSFVTINGGVKKPGNYEITTRTTLVELIALTGGTDTNADLSKVQLVRASDKAPETYNLQAFEEGKDPLGNPTLQDRDVIAVPETVTTTGYVTILGEVKKIGACELRNGMRLHEAIAQAGGPTEEADTWSATITHTSGVNQRIDLTKALAQDTKEDLVLTPGDTIYVPRITSTFNIMGAVNKAGQYPVKGVVRLTDALTLAMGPTAKAKLDKIQILRTDNKSVTANLTSDKNRAADNVTVLPGDTVMVPERRDGTNWLSALGSLASLGWILRP